MTFWGISKTFWKVIEIQEGGRPPRKPPKLWRVTEVWNQWRLHIFVLYLVRIFRYLFQDFHIFVLYLFWIFILRNLLHLCLHLWNMEKAKNLLKLVLSSSNVFPSSASFFTWCNKWEDFQKHEWMTSTGCVLQVHLLCCISFHSHHTDGRRCLAERGFSHSAIADDATLGSLSHLLLGKQMGR